MKKFTDIGQFRQVVREVRSHCDYIDRDENNDAIYRHTKPYPKLKFRGTVKSHGTNAGIVKYVDKYEFQSRENELTLKDDNSGFMREMSQKKYQKLFDGIEFNTSCAIFGEWCGMGIQKSVAISQLPNMFIIFAVKIDDVYQDMNNYRHLKIEDELIYNVLQFPTFEIEIDFNTPELIQNKLVELTNDVEKQCPIGNYFGVDGIGEGIVYEYVNGEERYIFKVKGELHAGKSKVKTLSTVDNVKMMKIKEIADKVTPTWRLAQMVEKSCNLMNGGELNRSKLGEYIRLVINDVIKEDLDIVTDAGLEMKDINKCISDIARHYFFDQEILK